MDEKSELPGLTEDEKKLFADLMPEDLEEILDTGLHRRHFLKLMGLAGGTLVAAQLMGVEQMAVRNLDEDPLPQGAYAENAVNLSIEVNGRKRAMTLDSRTSLLDALRENLALTGTKKGCDHGQCGACTVLVEDRRVLSCLTLAATCNNQKVTTIEGLAKGTTLHPMQASFLKHDGFQCGFCTPGQICSAVALVREAARGDASYVTKRLTTPVKAVILDEEEIRERMSGNICRCGAYPNIVAAIREIQSEGAMTMGLRG